MDGLLLSPDDNLLFSKGMHPSDRCIKMWGIKVRGINMWGIKMRGIKMWGIKVGHRVMPEA